nr:hypothetical protein [Abalone asfa-like virus]
MERECTNYVGLNIKDEIHLVTYTYSIDRSLFPPSDYVLKEPTQPNLTELMSICAARFMDCGVELVNTYSFPLYDQVSQNIILESFRAVEKNKLHLAKHIL